MELKKLDDDISSLFEDAKDKLKQAKEQAVKQLETNKKQIVSDLAKSLEDKIQTDTICIVIVNQLRGIVSGRFVRKTLDKKYKNKTRSNNAHKQKIPLLENKINVDELAEQVPLINKEMVIVGASGQSLVQRAGDHDDEQSSNKDNAYSSVKTSPTLLTKSPVKKTQELEQQVTKQSDTQGLKECPSGEERSSENLDTQDFQFSRSIKEISDYISTIVPKLGNSGLIWFSGTIDKNTGRIISSRFGKGKYTKSEPEED